MAIAYNPIAAAHEHCLANKEEILASEQCGCFYCLRIFGPKEIITWCPEKNNGETAICPHCHVDAVIGSAAGYPITTVFLSAMKNYWFSGS